MRLSIDSHKILERLKVTIAPPLIWLLIYFLGKTIRFTVYGEENYIRINGPVIFVFWHNRIFLLSYHYRYRLKKKNICVLVSPSIDGEILNRVFIKMGFSTIRGSSKHYSKKNMVDMIEKIKEGLNGAIVPDGPLGPKYIVKDGVVRLGRKVKIPLIPIVYNTSKRKILSTWDSFFLPLPFSRAVLIYGEPLLIEEDMDNEEGVRLLQERLKKITKEADEYFLKKVDKSEKE